MAMFFSFAGCRSRAVCVCAKPVSLRCLRSEWEHVRLGRVPDGRCSAEESGAAGYLRLSVQFYQNFPFGIAQDGFAVGEFLERHYFLESLD